MTAPIGVAVIGLGLAGGAMVPVIHAHPDFRLVAAVDPRDDLRSAFTAQEGPPAFADIDALWALPEIDAVYIASPHRFHREQAVAAARAGRHVIVEKPMALSLADCDDMIEQADRAGVQLVVGHSHGFDPVTAWLAEAVGAGRHGAIGMVSTWNYTDFLYRPRALSELDEALGGGIWFNQLPHQVDVVRTIIDREVLTVRAIASRLDPARRSAGSCAVLIEFEGEVAASLVYSGYDGFDTDELNGWVGEGGGSKQPTHGRARRSLEGLTADQEESARSSRYAYGRREVQAPIYQPHFGDLVVTCADADLRPTPTGVRTMGIGGAVDIDVPLGVWAGRGDVLDELNGGIRGGRPPRHDGRFARETVRVCSAALRSARDRREVDLRVEGTDAA